MSSTVGSAKSSQKMDKYKETLEWLADIHHRTLINSQKMDNMKLTYNDLQPHQKKFWDVVETLLKMGITPTPRVVNEALGKPIRTSWNGPLCQIRTYLLNEYGYELVDVGRFSSANTWRWKRKIDE